MNDIELNGERRTVKRWRTKRPDFDAGSATVRHVPDPGTD